MKFDEINQKFLKIPPFFISMATAAKFVLPIPIFLAYLVPLDVDAVPTCIKFHQFMFGHFGDFHGNGSHFEKINP